MKNAIKNNPSFHCQRPYQVRTHRAAKRGEKQQVMKDIRSNFCIPIVETNWWGFQKHLNQYEYDLSLARREDRLEMSYRDMAAADDWWDTFMFDPELAAEPDNNLSDDYLLGTYPEDDSDDYSTLMDEVDLSMHSPA